ncbi:hypothetical protein OTB20_38900 [Streptomyces sp. H27-H1]|uniref:hypothetical protein n=1 Tax=Streptomyces sp. H27-H1 TaxID=2996461 RepID=UPI00226F0B6F|nr:hypothetical protein [Streptomyces sp. H27-H1]MCY0932039.1 hypothetical protein [Streptomyces sp. H27-H1]
MSKIVASHTTASGTVIEVHDRGYDTEGRYRSKAMMVIRDPNGTERDRVYADTGTRWEDDPIAGLYRATVQLCP